MPYWAVVRCDDSRCAEERANDFETQLLKEIVQICRPCFLKPNPIADAVNARCRSAVNIHGTLASDGVTFVSALFAIILTYSGFPFGAS
jgi:hypothetical protein